MLALIESDEVMGMRRHPSERVTSLACRFAYKPLCGMKQSFLESSSSRLGAWTVKIHCATKFIIGDRIKDLLVFEMYRLLYGCPMLGNGSPCTSSYGLITVAAGASSVGVNSCWREGNMKHTQHTCLGRGSLQVILLSRRRS